MVFYNMRKYCLYIHINKLNGKVYIGISCNPLLRWKNGHGYKLNKHFWAAIQKYGWNGFLHIIVRTDLTLDEAQEQERRWIYLYRADDYRFGYNQTKGGEGRDFGKDCHSEEYMRSYREKNREKIKEREKEYMRSYREKNREKMNEYMRSYREKNREKMNKYMNEYLREYRKTQKILRGTP